MVTLPREALAQEHDPEEEIAPQRVGSERMKAFIVRFEETLTRWHTRVRKWNASEGTKRAIGGVGTLSLATRAMVNFPQNGG